MKLNAKIEDALTKMEFVKRYEDVSNKNNRERTPSSKRLVYLEREEVQEIIRELGYSSKFYAKEKFFKTAEEQIGDYTFCVHIILRDGMVDLVWVVREHGELLLGAPWKTYSRRLIDSSYIIKNPVFGDYEDLEEILKITFKMYEDFKAVFYMN